MARTLEQIMQESLGLQQWALLCARQQLEALTEQNAALAAKLDAASVDVSAKSTVTAFPRPDAASG